MIRPPPTSTLFPYTTVFRSLFAIQRVVTPKDLRLAAVQQLSGDHQPITCWMPLKAHVEFIGLGAIEQVPLTMCRRDTWCTVGGTLRSEEHTSELQSRLHLLG